MEIKGNLKSFTNTESTSYLTDTGSANAYAVALLPAITSYATGLKITFQAANANTGSSTLAVNGLTTKTIKKGISQNLAAGDIAANQIITLIYDGTNFQLVSSGEPPIGTVTFGQPGSNWLACDGSIYNTSSYPALSAICGAGITRAIFLPPTSESVAQTATSLISDGTTAVAVGPGGTIMTTTDGNTWTNAANSGTSNGLTYAAYGAGVWVAVSSLGSIVSSSDASTWASRTANVGSSTLLGVIYGNSLFVAWTNDGKITTSSDGTTWTAQTSQFSSTLISNIAYLNSLFVAVGGSGKISTSPDGATWTAQTSHVGNQLNSVAYGAGVWVAVGSSGGIGTITTSPDGTNWTSRWAGTSSSIFFDIVFAAGLFVIIGQNSSQYFIYTSPDGTTWTGRGNPVPGAAIVPRRILYIGSIFIILSQSLSQPLISQDGIIWSLGMGEVASTSLNSMPVTSIGTKLIALTGNNGPVTRFANVPTGSQFQVPYLAEQGIMKYIRAI